MARARTRSLLTPRHPATSRRGRRPAGETVATGTGNPGGGSRGHAVMFHRNRGELAGQVSAYLLEAVRAGVATTMAAPQHRRAISDRLAQAGVDVAAAEAAGSLVALDAVETVRGFMVAEWPSAAGFWEVI